VAIQKIIAASVNEGLRIIRDQLGSDAMIIKTVKRNNKVELFVDSPKEIESAIQAVNEQAEGSDSAIQEEYQQAKLKMLSSLGDLPEQELKPQVENYQIDSHLNQLSSSGSLVQQSRQSYRQSYSAQAEKSFDSILGSIKSAGSSNEKTVSSILEKLRLDEGICAELRSCRRLDELIAKLATRISEQEKPALGIKAFVGPAGGGKTTTMLKLITRQVMQLGPESCAIINCDRYRSGAKEQLVRMGELLDVQVMNTSSKFNLNQAIAKVAHRGLVVIDMPGLGFTDPLLHGELFKLSSSNYSIDRYLVLPAYLQKTDMERALKVHGKRASVIFTHLDDCTSLGVALSFLIKNSLKLAYISDGPHIPKDLSRGVGIDLIRRAIALADSSLTRAMNTSAPEVAKTPISDFTNGGSQRKVSSAMVMDV